jgi:hypothetical protein
MPCTYPPPTHSASPAPRRRAPPPSLGPLSPPPGAFRYLYAFGLIATGLLQSLLHQWAFYFAWKATVQMKVAATNMVFAKVPP